MSASTALFPNGLPTGVNYSYGSGYTYTGNFVGVPSLTFYPTSAPPATLSDWRHLERHYSLGHAVSLYHECDL